MVVKPAGEKMSDVTKALDPIEFSHRLLVEPVGNSAQ